MAAKRGPQAPTLPEPASPALALHLLVFEKEGVVAHRLAPGTALTVGRASGCDVVVETPALSRKHFEVTGGPPPAVVDLGSANGTRIGGKRLQANVARPVAFGEPIQAGGMFFVVQDHDPRELRESARWSAKPPEASAAQPDVVVSDPAMKELYDLVTLVARSELPVLVVGETGAAGPVAPPT